MKKVLKIRNLIIAALVCLTTITIIYFNIPQYEIRLLADDLQLKVNETKYVELQFEVINLKPVFRSEKKLQAYKQLVQEEFPKYFIVHYVKESNKKNILQAETNKVFCFDSIIPPEDKDKLGVFVTGKQPGEVEFVITIADIKLKDLNPKVPLGGLSTSIHITVLPDDGITANPETIDSDSMNVEIYDFDTSEIINIESLNR